MSWKCFRAHPKEIDKIIEFNQTEIRESKHFLDTAQNRLINANRIYLDFKYGKEISNVRKTITYLRLEMKGSKIFWTQPKTN